MRLKLNAAFALAGVATTVLGPMMPQLQARWHLGDADGGLLFTVQFVASIIGSIVVGPVNRRLGYMPTAACGFVLVGLGLSGYPLVSWPLALLCAIVVGLGLGLAIPSGNMAVSGDARGVLWINWSWCAGAMIVPALAAYLSSSVWWWVAGGAGIAAVALWLEPSAPPLPASDRSNWQLTAVGRFAAASLFLYVAVEASIGGWIASLVHRNPDAASYWAVATSVFWVGLLLGRALASAMLAKRTPTYLIWRGLIIASIGATGLVLAQSGALTLAAGAVCGFGLAPIYPMVVAEYARREIVGAPLSSLVFAAGNIGGSIGPLLTGYISQTTGSLRLGVATSLLSLAGMLWMRRGMKTGLIPKV